MTSEKLPTGEMIQVEDGLAAVTLDRLRLCDHEWVVFSTDVANVFLMLECVECGAFATVNDPSLVEWEQAFPASEHPYRWDHKQRVTIRGIGPYRHVLRNDYPGDFDDRIDPELRREGDAVAHIRPDVPGPADSSGNLAHSRPEFEAGEADHD